MVELVGVGLVAALSLGCVGCEGPCECVANRAAVG